MQQYRIWMAVGIVTMVIGALLLSVMQTYYEGGSYYGGTYIGGSIVWGKTLGLLAVKAAVLGAGYLVYRHGQNLRDGR